MKKSLETLKSYFKTGDKPTQENYEDLLESLVHKNDLLTSAIENTVFIDSQDGDDTTAEIGNIIKPYLTIDAAVTAFELANPRQGDIDNLDHPFLNIQLISDGTYEINEQLPQRNIRFESKEACTIDFSNNTNEYFNVLVAGTYHKYIFSLPNGKLLNNSENKLFGDYLFFEGEFDVIESYGPAYSVFGKGFIVANQVNVTYNLLKGNGIVFSTLNNNTVNTFKGNIESIGAKLMVNNEGKGINYFDFDEAKGTHELALLKASLSTVSYVNFGKYRPDVTSEIMKIAHTGKLYINFKENAETYGSFNAGEVHFTGNKVTVNASLARLQYKLFFDNISIKATTVLSTVISGISQVFIKNSYIETPSSIIAIESNTNFSVDVLNFIGYNSIYQTNTPGGDLVTKYSGTEPSNVSYKVELQNSLITNGVLNTTITGTTNTTATLTIGTTNTY
jgi:hypothetical protein